MNMSFILCNVYCCLTISLPGPLSHVFITYVPNLACGLKLLPLIDQPVRKSKHLATSRFASTSCHCCRQLRTNYRPDGADEFFGRHGGCVADWDWLLWEQDRGSGDGGQKVRDDEDGHLLYEAGDILQARCTWHFVMFRFRIIFIVFVAYIVPSFCRFECIGACLTTAPDVFKCHCICMPP